MIYVERTKFIKIHQEIFQVLEITGGRNVCLFNAQKVQINSAKNPKKEYIEFD